MYIKQILSNITNYLKTKRINFHTFFYGHSSWNRILRIHSHKISILIQIDVFKLHSQTKLVFFTFNVLGKQYLFRYGLLSYFVIFIFYAKQNKSSMYHGDDMWCRKKIKLMFSNGFVA